MRYGLFLLWHGWANDTNVTNWPEFSGILSIGWTTQLVSQRISNDCIKPVSFVSYNLISMSIKNNMEFKLSSLGHPSKSCWPLWKNVSWQWDLLFFLQAVSCLFVLSFLWFSPLHKVHNLVVKHDHHRLVVGGAKFMNFSIIYYFQFRMRQKALNTMIKALKASLIRKVTRLDRYDKYVLFKCFCRISWYKGCPTIWIDIRTLSLVKISMS